MSDNPDINEPLLTLYINEDWNSQYIGGDWHRAEKDGIPVEDPSTRDTIATVPAGTKSDIDAAYAAAVDSQQGWASTSPSERSRILRQFADAVQAVETELREILRAEAGSTKIKCDFEIATTRQVAHDAASLPSRMSGDHRQSNIEGKENIIRREPRGVVTVISPWNYPLNLSLRAVAPAIATGNSVVLKPATPTPISGGLAIARLFEETDLPDGVLNVVAGRGSVLGDHLAGHPAADVVAFTGSSGIGRRVAAKAAESMALPAMELGGNSPHIVLEDAPLEQAVDAAVYGTWLHQGQSCTTINRHLIHRSVYDEYVERLVNRARQLPTGSAHDPETIVGPLIHESHRENILELIDNTVAAGATLEYGGEVDGLVVEPTVLSGVTNGMAAACNEHFGPIAPVIPFENDSEAVEIANDTEYGLSASVFSGDTNRAANLADKIDSGMIHINDQSINEEPHVPFGGINDSGIGRFNGDEILQEFTEPRWVSIQRQPREYPF